MKISKSNLNDIIPRPKGNIIFYWCLDPDNKIESIEYKHEDHEYSINSQMFNKMPSLTESKIINYIIKKILTEYNGVNQEFTISGLEFIKKALGKKDFSGDAYSQIFKSLVLLKSITIVNLKNKKDVWGYLDNATVDPLNNKITIRLNNVFYKHLTMSKNYYLINCLKYTHIRKPLTAKWYEYLMSNVEKKESNPILIKTLADDLTYKLIRRSRFLDDLEIASKEVETIFGLSNSFVVDKSNNTILPMILNNDNLLMNDIEKLYRRVPNDLIVINELKSWIQESYYNIKTNDKTENAYYMLLADLLYFNENYPPRASDTNRVGLFQKNISEHYGKQKYNNWKINNFVDINNMENLVLSKLEKEKENDYLLEYESCNDDNKQIIDKLSEREIEYDIFENNSEGDKASNRRARNKALDKIKFAI